MMTVSRISGRSVGGDLRMDGAAALHYALQAPADITGPVRTMLC
jgi:hypothetical protein